jgi:recombination protein RecT
MENNTQLTIKNLFQKDEVRNKFQEMLGKRAPSFITSVLQIVASNGLLAKADPHSVYHSAAVAATLDLPLNNNLGFAYIVPYNQKYKEVEVDEKGNKRDVWKSKQVAQFQIGYKGFKQLALRSGQFKLMNTTDIREGEIKKRDRKTGEIIIEWIVDEDEREKAAIVGYLNYFELINGYSHSLYMTIKQLDRHAKKYSQTYKMNKGLWVDDPESMRMKTVTKLNLSKDAPLSVEMQKAIVFDQAVVNDVDTQDVEYTDNQPIQIEDVTVDQLQELLDEKIALLNKADFDSAKRIIDNKEETSYNKLFKTLTELSE